MDVAQYATLAANLGLAGFMAVMLLTWHKQSNDRELNDAREREKDTKRDDKKCLECAQKHERDYQLLLDKVLEQFQQNTRFMESVSVGLATRSRLEQVEKMLARQKNGDD
jgi:hypothetical protein